MINYSSMVDDKPLANYYGKGQAGPKNWYKGYDGLMTVAEALERSNNTIPCHLVQQIGTRATYYYLQNNLGIDSLDTVEDNNLSSLGLGGTYTGITTTQSAAAFAVFGNMGTYYEPTTFTLMTDQHDTVILKQSSGIAAIDENTATIMNYMLRNVVYGGSGTGRGAGGYVRNMKIYAKTGTSNNTRDLWFVGGTPYYVASCWTGYDNNYTINSSSIAQRMWGAVMSDIHKGLKAKSFKDSKYVSKRYYCAETGLLATTECTAKEMGYYKNSYLPTCSHHGGTLLSPISGNSKTKNGKSGIVKGKVTGLIELEPEEEEEDGSSSEGSSSENNSSSITFPDLPLNPTFSQTTP
jgi:penicillin-binding protein 1A